MVDPTAKDVTRCRASERTIETPFGLKPLVGREAADAQRVDVEDHRGAIEVAHAFGLHPHVVFDRNTLDRRDAVSNTGGQLEHARPHRFPICCMAMVRKIEACEDRHGRAGGLERIERAFQSHRFG